MLVNLSRPPRHKENLYAPPSARPSLYGRQPPRRLRTRHMRGRRSTEGSTAKLTNRQQQTQNRQQLRYRGHPAVNFVANPDAVGGGGTRRRSPTP